VSDVKPGQWVNIVGIGGLGHIAIQYAKAMGMNVVATDIDNEKLELAKKMGADLVVNALETDPAEFMHEKLGGVQAAVVVAVGKIAFNQAYKTIRRGGKLVAVGLPEGSIDVPIFETVLNAITVVGSIVGTRKDLVETLQFAADGKIKSNIEVRKLEEINDIFTEMEQGKINGRIVVDMNI